MSWLKKFLEKFGEATERHPQIRRVQDLKNIEDAVQKYRKSNRCSVKDFMREVINSPEWPYDKWWNDLSEQLKSDIILPENLNEPKSKKYAINALHEDLKDIEVVSVVLRFWCPAEFGIISPPVVWLLSLAPSRYRVKDYLHYLDNLTKLAEKHGLQRLADADMGLWSAAHLIDKYPDLAAEMYEDQHFQQIRLANLLRGLGERWQPTPHLQLELAKALLPHDYLTAALVASRPFEWVISQMALQFGMKKWTRRTKITKLRYYVPLLSSCDKFLDEVAPKLTARLSTLKVYRNKAVHPDEPEQEEELKRPEAKELIESVDKLIAWLDAHSN